MEEKGGKQERSKHREGEQGEEGRGKEKGDGRRRHVDRPLTRKRRASGRAKPGVFLLVLRSSSRIRMTARQLCSSPPVGSLHPRVRTPFCFPLCALLEDSLLIVYLYWTQFMFMNLCSPFYPLSYFLFRFSLFHYYISPSLCPLVFPFLTTIPSPCFLLFICLVTLLSSIKSLSVKIDYCNDISSYSFFISDNARTAFINLLF